MTYQDLIDRTICLVNLRKQLEPLSAEIARAFDVNGFTWSEKTPPTQWMILTELNRLIDGVTTDPTGHSRRTGRLFVSVEKTGQEWEARCGMEIDRSGWVAGEEE